MSYFIYSIYFFVSVKTRVIVKELVDSKKRTLSFSRYIYEIVYKKKE